MRFFTMLSGVLLIASSQASLQCNVYNFGLNGAFTCALEWWQSNDLGQEIDFDLKVSDIVSEALTMFNISLAEINMTLFNNINASSPDPLSKIIESGAVVEPYVLFVVADLLLGQNITVAELQMFGLPAALADRSQLQTMYKRYFDASCTSYGVRPFVTCMQTWMDDNCVEEDKPEVIMSFLSNVRDEYCSSNTNAKPQLLQKLNNDLGSVFSSVLDFIGIYKDTDSPYLFNLSENSIIFNWTIWERVGQVLETDCFYLIQSLTADFPILLTPTSTAGTGRIMESMIRFANSASRCVFRGWKKVFPTFFEDHKNAISHIETVGRRYGLDSISTNSTNVGTIERASVIVFGDPHMLTYQATKTQTCAALGWQTYLSNEYFQLMAYAEAACPTCQASYVTMVNVSFTGLDSQIHYESGDGDQPVKLLTIDGVDSTDGTAEIEINDFGESVQVTDLRSGAVFGFKKYRHTYYFTVRMGVEVFDASLGLLITGCPEEIDVTTDSVTGRKRRSNTECEQACASVPQQELYLDACIFDCDTTNDMQVAEISIGAASLEGDVEMSDERIYESLGVTTALPTTTVEVTTSSAVLAQGLPLYMLCQMTALLLLLNTRN